MPILNSQATNMKPTSLSCLAATHLQNKRDQWSLSGLSSKQLPTGVGVGSVSGESRSTQDMMVASTCSPLLQSGRSPLNPTLHHTKQSSEPGLERGSFRFNMQEESPKPSLSSLASQHFAKSGKTMQPPLSFKQITSHNEVANVSAVANVSCEGSVLIKPGLLPGNYPSRENTNALAISREPLAVQTETSDARGSRFNQPSLTSLAAHHLSSRPLSKSGLVAVSGFPAASSHRSQTASSVATNLGCSSDLHPRPFEHTHVLSVPSLQQSRVTSLGELVSCHAANKSAAKALPKEGADVSMADSFEANYFLHTLQSHLSQCGNKLGPSQQSPCEERPFRNTQKNIKPPPGFRAAPITSVDCSVSGVELCVSSDTSAKPQDHLHVKQSLLQPSLLARPSTFAIALCRDYSFSQVNRKVKAARKVVMKQMFFDFNSFNMFHFSTFSPDDAVRDKQTKGFQK